MTDTVAAGATNADATSLSNTLNAAPDVAKGVQQAAPSGGNVARHDPSLLHQISSLQTEKQDLLTARRELETKIKALEDEKQQTATEMEKAKEAHQKEKQEFTEVYRREMQKMKDDFMNEWMETLSKLSPEVITKMKTGVDHMINNGMKQDRMWEILCTASKAHKMNVDTIEELRMTNTMLSDKNKDLEERLRGNAGFSATEARFNAVDSNAMAGRKRTRTDDLPNGALGQEGGATRTAEAPLATTDVWGHFEKLMMHSNNSV